MIVNSNVMLNNTVSIAKKQLEAHVKQGAKSNLNIFEVARLMDMIRQQNDQKNEGEQSVFFGFSHN